jgi:hypothetical protein
MVAAGCAIKGCLHPPHDIDHDHSIHPQTDHSCDECRRGMLCTFHNRGAVAFMDSLMRGDMDNVLEYLGVRMVLEKVSS